MKLFNNNEDEFQNYIERSINSKIVELEVQFGSSVPKNPIKKKEFLSLIEQCKKNYEMISESSSLDIRTVYKNRPGNIRCTIHGINNIKKYCKENSLENINKSDIEYIQKKLYIDHTNPDKKYPPLRDLDYNVRLNIKTEVPLSSSNRMVSKLLMNLNENPKYFRYKKRFSFLTVDKLFRIDLTVIKQTKYEKNRFHFEKTFKNANILQNKEEYELEIEYIGWNEDVGIPEIDNLYKHFNNKYISGPGKETLGNIYDPLNLGIHIFETEDKKLSMEDEKEFYNKPSLLVDSKEIEKYKYLLGKYVKIKDRYFEEKNIDLKLRDSIKEYYEKGHYIGIVKGFTKEPFEDTEAIVVLEPMIGNYSQLTVPINYLYDDLSFSPNKGIIGKLDTMSISELQSIAVNEGIPIEEINEAIETDKFLENPNTLISLIHDNLKEIDSQDDNPAQFLPSRLPEKEVDNDSIQLEIIQKLQDILESHVVDLTKVIYNTNTIIPFQTKEEVIKKYRETTGQKRYYDFSFIGPQPKTLTMDNIKLNNPNSILKDYAVTEKADGERYELLIFNKRGYLINAKQNVIDTNVIFENYPGIWLFDGEYITKTKENEPIQLYMVFDIYWNGNTTPEPIHTYPFLSRNTFGVSRSSVLKDFFLNVNMVKDTDSIDIQMKQYEYGYITKIDEDEPLEEYEFSNDIMGIFKASNKILNKEEEDYYPYRIDGLIYLPLYLSVKSSIEGIQSKFISGTWENNFKWKPPEENTIDFLVKVKKTMIQSKVIDQILPFNDISEEGIKITHQYKQLELYVGYDKYKDRSINFCMKVLEDKKGEKVTDEDKVQKFNFNETVENKYDITNINLKDGKMVCLNYEEDEIKDGDFVEMRFNPNAKNSMNWEPLRVRSDKSKPQFFTIAYDVWDTINNPITKDMIQGDYELEEYIKDDKHGKYYVNESENLLFESSPLKKIHNYIKTKLITLVCKSFNKPIQILDLSFGQGGDTKKYLNNEINCSFLLGLDISSNIDEACKRVYREKTNTKTAFFRADTSKNIQNGECTEIDGITEEERIHSNTLINILYGVNKSIPEEYTNIQRRYYGIAKNGFDVISSQFSLHYYFKNKDTLNGFIQNLKDNLNKGGFFIGTCYDGNSIFDHFKKMDSLMNIDIGVDDEDYEEYTLFESKDIFQNKIFSIEKKYSIKEFTYNPEEKENMFGNKIEVFMDSIGQPIDEYLVNFDFFKDIMKENGFEIYVPKGQSTIFKKNYFENGLGQFKNVIQNLSELRETDEIFKKYYSEAYQTKEVVKGKDGKFNKRTITIEPLNLTGNLETLSSFNNYFIFQRNK